MKILLCHNYYKLPGGEDQVFQDESWLLEKHGHTVLRFEKRNTEIDRMGKLEAARLTIWNSSVRAELEKLIHRNKPDLVHYHNTFPLISPAAYDAAKRFGVPVVQTLHNFRIICPGATLVRNGAICEKCVHKTIAWPAVIHRCYRDNTAATGVVALRNVIHRLRGAWTKHVDQFIALTNHSRNIFIHAGLPHEKVAVKPNFVRPDPGQREKEGEYAVFVGRLSHEKGVKVLLQAWQDHDCIVPLVIIGEGPLRDQVAAAAAENPKITWLGQRRFPEVLERIRNAKLLVMPSIWYETFGRTMIEAFATGVPVIASNIGAMQEIVSHKKTGLHFQTGSAQDLAAQVNALAMDNELRAALGNHARHEYLDKFTAEKNYETLINIYEHAIAG